MNDSEQPFVRESASGADHPMSAALIESFDLNIPVAGEVREGEVVFTHKSEILIDIGAKSEAIIPAREVESFDEETREALSVGNTVRILVVNPEDRDGNIVVSYAKALEEQDWDYAADLMDQQEIFEGKVVGYNRGGLIVRVGQLRGFVPASQLSPDRQVRRGSAGAENALSQAVGQKLYAKIIEVSRNRNRLILSERAAMREVRESRKAEVLAKLEEGEIRTGRVVNLADFGAFVDIGGVEGLVHLSELSWKRVNKPGEVLAVGDEVRVYILNVDTDRQRVGLSIKRLQPDPWDTIDEHYHVGQLVEATVTKLARYGAFACLNDEYGLEGLIHISELSDDHVKHPNEVVQKSQVTTARIIRIDPQQRQIGLSLKQVSSHEYMDADLALADEDIDDEGDEIEEDEGNETE